MFKNNQKIKVTFYPNGIVLGTKTRDFGVICEEYEGLIPFDSVPEKYNLSLFNSLTKGEKTESSASFARRFRRCQIFPHGFASSLFFQA